MEAIYKKGEKLVNEISETRIPENAISFWNLGQAGILLKGREEDGLICIDPYLTDSIEKSDPTTEFKRAFPPVVKPDMLSNLDGVLVTHEHGDHLDMETIKEIARVSDNTSFAVPAPLESLLNDNLPKPSIIPARDGITFSIKEFTITPVPAAHAEYEKDANGDYKQLGYFIEVNGIRLFHSGDTVVTPPLLERVKEYKPHVAFLPINGGDHFRTARNIVGNMTFREAAEFAVTVGADLMVPIHYDLFPNNTDNPAHFVDYLFHHYPSQKFHMMAPGERFIYHC